MVNFFNDIASDEDYLGYHPYIEAFNYILENCNELITPPFVFGIHGKWGMGKTTFMNLIKSRIDKEKSFYTININPWEYGKNQNFITIFLAKLYQEVQLKINIQGKKSGEDFIKSIFKPLKLSLDLKAIKMEYDFDKFSFDQQKAVINKFISDNFALKQSINYILNHEFISRKKIVVFVDDLDRCDVYKVMEVIESIKLIFNSKNCIFFLGCDINYLQSALSNKYEKFINFSKENSQDKSISDIDNFSREYLEKIIQIPFYIPAIDAKSIKKYIQSILWNKRVNNKQISIEKNAFLNFKNDLKDDFLSDIIIAADINPRRIKRIINLTFLNYIFMKFKNVENNNLTINTKLLALFCIIREVYPNYYKEKISNELLCRNVIEKFFVSFIKDKNEDNKLIPLDWKFTPVEDVINAQKEKTIKDVNEELEKKNIKTIDEKIYDLFELYFKDRNINTVEELSNDLYYISLYISVSNLNVRNDIDDDTEQWGELANIKSDITGKRLSLFLNNLIGNTAAKNFVYWFFGELYVNNREDYILGIVKNVNIYLSINEKRVWIFRFDFDSKQNILNILFKWRNEYNCPIEKLEDCVTTQRFEPKNKRISISEKLSYDDLEIIKQDIVNIIDIIKKEM
ncbi:KAP family P-loop NTPase fold protein [Clostridium neonatale]|nr:P-loop NTPase fold protein [Clostridium neonatale]MDU4846722.1 P-loop NTPase fold protein [Clostridium sp.]CAH0437301.1 Conserved hypothetical protein, KAP family P-loop domain [Clostridium neonatale]